MLRLLGANGSRVRTLPTRQSRVYGGGGDRLRQALAFWPLDESSGDALDASGNGRTLALTGTAGASSVRIAGCGRSFGGSAFLRRDGALVTGGPLTMACWLRAYNQVNVKIFAFAQHAGTSLLTMRQGIFGEDESIVYGTANGGLNSIEAHGNGQDGSWRHMVFTWDNDTLRGYADGVQIGSPVSGTADYSSLTGIGVALGDGSGDYYMGDIALPGIWPFALTEAEIARLYNSGSGLNPYA
ncbi:MAG: LamG-like jellyroll fold domain-containing protein [Gemmataceae bacterium]